MNIAKWVISISAVYIFCLITHGRGQEVDGTIDTEDVKLKKTDKVIECNTGKCNSSKCECCPGYGFKESGLWFKSYSCEKCDCGLDIGCSFSWFGKTCVCPAGYSYIAGFCRELIFVQWLNALVNFIALTLVIAFTLVKWLFFLLYYVAYFAVFIGFTAVKWIFYLAYFLAYCLYILALYTVKFLYILLYNGAIILVIALLILPMTMNIEFIDYFLLWYLMGKLFLNKFEKHQKMNMTTTVEDPNDNYNKICDLLKKIFQLKTDAIPVNADEVALKDFMYHCPICLGSQIEILLDKGSFYTMECGHIYCNSCIENMQGSTDVKCAVCKATCKRDSFRKIFLL